MFSSFIKIKPTLDSATTGAMVNTLNARFGAVAKKFGGGLKTTLKAAIGGSLIAGGAALVSKLMNPIKEVEQSLNDTLQSADEIVTKAKQFDSSAGKYFKLQQVAKSAGLEGDTLNVMLGKFQVALAEARGGKQNAAMGFVKEKDTAEAFFKFAQQLQTLPKDQQVLAQQDIFGERMIGKAAEFFTTDLVKQMKLIGGPSAASVNSRIERGANLEDYQSIQNVRTSSADFLAKLNLIDKSKIDAMTVAQQTQNQLEQNRLQNFADIKQISNTTEKISTTLETYLRDLTSNVLNMGKSTDKIKNSRPNRGIQPIDFLGY